MKHHIAKLAFVVIFFTTLGYIAKYPSINFQPDYLFQHVVVSFKDVPQDSKEHALLNDKVYEVIEKITDSRFVISSPLHGLIVAEAFGIPARMLRITTHEPLLKYQDYYYGTNRPYFQYAQSIEEAFQMGGEPPFECDLQKLYEAFPFEYWEMKPYEQQISRHDLEKNYFSK